MHGSDMDMDNMVTESLGTLLKQTRRGQQKSINDAAAATRIHTHTLQAIEADDYSGMRAEIFVRGFIKIYAVYLGIDPGEALAIYDKSGLRPPGYEPHHLEEDDAGLEEYESPPLISNRLLLGAVLVILALIFISGKNIFFDRDRTADVPPAPIPLNRIEIPAPAPETMTTADRDRPAYQEKGKTAETTAAARTTKIETYSPVATKAKETPPATKKMPPPIRYTVVAKFVESTWMKIIIDNGPARQYTYHPGESRTWKARKKMRLFIGNAGGIRITVNGEAMPPLGPSGEVARLSIPMGLAKLREKEKDIPRQPEVFDSGETPAPTVAPTEPEPAPESSVSPYTENETTADAAPPTPVQAETEPVVPAAVTPTQAEDVAQ